MKILWHQENMPHMNVRKNKGVTYLTWPEFEKIPGFCTRVQRQAWRSQ